MCCYRYDNTGLDVALQDAILPNKPIQKCPSCHLQLSSSNSQMRRAGPEVKYSIAQTSSYSQYQNLNKLQAGSQKLEACLEHIQGSLELNFYCLWPHFRLSLFATTIISGSPTAVSSSSPSSSFLPASTSCRRCAKRRLRRRRQTCVAPTARAASADLSSFQSKKPKTCSRPREAERQTLSSNGKIFFSLTKRSSLVQHACNDCSKERKFV